MINAQASRDPTLMGLLRQFVVLCMKFNVQFRAKHIPGKKNLLADRISRFQMAEARSLNPRLHDYPHQILPSWLPWNMGPG